MTIKRGNEGGFGGGGVILHPDCGGVGGIEYMHVLILIEQYSK